jgi:hypothetical protein
MTMSIHPSHFFLTQNFTIRLWETVPLTTYHTALPQLPPPDSVSRVSTGSYARMIARCWPSDYRLVNLRAISER